MIDWHMILSYVVLAAEPPAAEPSGGLDLNALVTLLIGGGLAGLLAAIVSGYRSWKRGKLEDEETLIARLNADSKAQGDRADLAEQRLADVRAEADRVANELRAQRDEAREDVAWYRSFLIQQGYQLDPMVGRPWTRGGQHRGE